MPNRYQTWDGGPSFRSSQDDDLLQMADLIAHALSKRRRNGPKG